MRTSATRFTPIRKRSGKPLGARPWANTATCTAGQTCCFWQMSSKCSERRASTSTAWTQPTTIPALAFRGTPLLKKTGVELELLTDYDQHLFIEKGLRGGISMTSKRYAKANNPLVEGYDPEKPNIHISYLDANNLYGWTMSQYLHRRRVSVGGRLPTTRKNHRRASGRRARRLHT